MRLSRISKILIAADVILLVAIICVVGLTMHARAGVAHRLHHTIHNPHLLMPFVVQLGLEFFFGSVNGTIAQFATQQLSSDVSGLAGNAVFMADALTKQFYAQQQSPYCTQKTTCPASGVTVVCPNNRPVYCPQAGMVVDCNYASCIANKSIHGSSLVSSIASKLLWMHRPPVPYQWLPAFSDGIFRLDKMFEWVRAQLRRGPWHSAGFGCRFITQQVERISWRGIYFDAESGRYREWDANEGVRKVSDTVSQFCDALSGLPYNATTLQ